MNSFILVLVGAMFFRMAGVMWRWGVGFSLGRGEASYGLPILARGL